MKSAILYAGQGSQYVGMGKDLYESAPEFRQEFDKASEAVKFDLYNICFEDCEGRLNLTEYTQPAMVAFACGLNAALKAMLIKPDYVCGLSLGEYSALHFSNVLDTTTVVKMVEFRGKAMTSASCNRDVIMYAVMGIPDDKLEECCECAKEKGVVSICNYNHASQRVIGGERTAVEFAAKEAKNMGAKRCLPLNVSVASHTVLMKPAGDALADYFKEIHFGEMQVPVIFNCLGSEKNDETIEELLVNQVQKPVKMEQSLRYLLSNDVRRFIEVGPGKVLGSFVKKTAKEMNIYDFEVLSLENYSDLCALRKIYS